MISEQRTVSVFKGIEVEDGIEVIIEKGDTQKVVVEAPENFISNVKTTVDNQVLKMDVSGILNGSWRAKVYITVPAMENITLSGGSSAKSDDVFISDQFHASLSGGSVLQFRPLVKIATVEASGGSEVSLKGYLEHLKLDELSGGSVFKGFNYVADSCTAIVSGGSRAEVYVQEELKVNVSGGSTFKYRGYPNIHQQSSGGSEIINAN